MIYVNKDKKAARPNRRLWAMGNYSKFIRPGFVRADLSSDNEKVNAMRPVAFKGIDDGDGKEKLVVVFINRNEAQTVALEGIEGYSGYEVYTTSEDKDLELTASGSFETGTEYAVAEASIVTVVLSK